MFMYTQCTGTWQFDLRIPNGRSICGFRMAGRFADSEWQVDLRIPKGRSICGFRRAGRFADSEGQVDLRIEHY
jgi:hypothetical protein